MNNTTMLKTKQGWRCCVLAILALLVGIGSQALAGPSVANVRSSQRAGTKLVDIYYDVSGGTPPFSVTLQVSNDSGATYGVAASSFTGDVGSGLTAGSGKHVVWNAGADWNGNATANMRFKVMASDSAMPPAPAGFALIPAGSFQMGNCMDSNEGWYNELPVHLVYVSAFYMEKMLVTKAQWDGVRTWGLAHGYSIETSGSGKAINHPVWYVSWYNVVKWCNARSEQEGLTPCYKVGGIVYRTGWGISPECNWSADGYRLPTEAEWEKAARGGLSNKRFPCGDTISRSQANYYVCNSGSTNLYNFDLGTPVGFDPKYNDGVYPYTSPVGSFEANGYGLYDMEGDIMEWCWDWYSSSYYGSSPVNDPCGPDAGSNRILRGGYWYGYATECRVAHRGVAGSPGSVSNCIGFRCARR